MTSIQRTLVVLGMVGVLTRCHGSGDALSAGADGGGVTGDDPGGRRDVVLGAFDGNRAPDSAHLCRSPL
jgi:hypothetical protein